jgi:PAS domain-containing protein
MTDLSAALGSALLSSASDAIVAADREGVIRFWNPGAARIFSVPAVTKDGADISVEFTIVPLHDGPQIVGLVAVMRDVTARFREMRELRRKVAEAKG